MANKPTQPVFPLGLAAEEQSTLAGVLNTGTIEHGPDAVLTLPEGNASAGLPSSVRYNADSDEFEGFYENGGWLPLGGGGIRWEVLPHASTATLTEGRGYLINNTTGASTVVLPSPTRIGDSVTICDAYGKFATYPLTVSPSGNNLYGSTEDMAITTDNVSATFTWSGPEQGWVITSGVGLGQGRVYSREIFTKILASETSAVALNTPPTIVDVYADGKRLAESKYSLDGNVITFSPSLPANTELQVIEYTPIQLGNSGGSGSSTITWVYNGGSAIGGETEITLDVVVDDVPAIDINGSRQYKNLGFTFDPLTSKIYLAQELEPEDEVVVIINGTPNIYNQIDHTLREVARATNVKDSEVILSSDTTQSLNGKKIIYSVSEQKAYSLPTLPSNVFIESVESGKLTYSPGSIKVDLLPLPNDSAVTEQAILNQLSAIEGESLIGTVTYVTLREYTGSATRVKCIGRSVEGDGGEGDFYLVPGDSTSVDDDGVIIVDGSGRRWKRSYSGPISASWFGVRDGTDVTTTLQNAVSRGGGQIFVQDGQYTLTAPIVANFTGASFPIMGRKSKRFDFIGSSMANTTFNTNGNEAFSFTGTDGSVAGQGVHSGARISDFSVYGTNNTGIGVRLVGAAYLKVHDLQIKRTNIAMRISGVLSSDIKRINAQYNNHGMYITSASNSTVNAMRISGMFGANSKWGIEGEVGTNVYIEDSNFEGNGTDGDELSGAIYLRVVEPLSTINISGYFEANVGRADILIDNRTSSPLVVNLRGCVFNRGGMRGGSNLGIGAKYNVETRSTGGGPIILNLNGCVFFTQTGFGYVPSADSPYIQPAPYLTVNGEDTCYFSESTSRGETGNRGMTLGISMKADGTMANKPPFLTSTRVSAGVYTITHNTRFGTDIDHFQAVATSKASGFTVSYVQKVNLQALRIVTLNAAGSPADTDFDVIVTSRR